MKKSIRVLHIDDNLHDRQLVKDAVMKESDGFEIVEVDNRSKFEKHLAENDFDLVLSDFNILGFDGFQVIKLVKEKNPEIPVIIVTGTGSEEIAVQAMKMGADDYVIKSVKHIASLAPTIKNVIERKKLQREYNETLQALVDSDKELRAAQQLANLGSWKWFIGSDRVIWSDELYRLFVYDFTLLPPNFSKMETFYTHQSWIRLKNTIDNSLETGEAFEIELDVVQTNGKLRNTVARAAVDFDENGEIISLHGTLQDITERKITEEKLRQASENWTHTFNSIQDGIVLLDKDQNILDANQTFLKIIGKNRDEVVGQHCWPCVHGGECPADGCPFIRAKDSHKRETMAMQRNGLEYEVMVDPIFDQNNNLTGAIHIITDITERIRAEEALRNSEEKYRNIFDNVQDVFYQVDLEGKVIEISPSVKYFSEFNRDEIIGRPVYNLYENPQDRERLLVELYNNGELKDFEVMLKTKSENVKHVSINARLINDPSGKPHHIVGALRDITDRKLIELAKEKELKDIKLFHNLTVGRELKMIELKNEINELCKKLGEEKRYNTPDQ